MSSSYQRLRLNRMKQTARGGSPGTDGDRAQANQSAELQDVLSIKLNSMQKHIDPIEEDDTDDEDSDFLD